MKKHLLLPMAIAASMALAGCEGMTPTQQSTLSGGAIGAAGGAAIGAIGGNAGLGAAAGGAAGLTTGFLLGRHREAVRRSYEQGRASQRATGQ
jgi:hypothetical protein